MGSTARSSTSWRCAPFRETTGYPSPVPNPTKRKLSPIILLLVHAITKSTQEAAPQLPRPPRAAPPRPPAPRPPLAPAAPPPCSLGTPLRSRYRTRVPRVSMVQHVRAANKATSGRGDRLVQQCGSTVARFGPSVFNPDGQYLELTSQPEVLHLGSEIILERHIATFATVIALHSRQLCHSAHQSAPISSRYSCS